MKFAVYDLNKDSLEVTVFDKDLFSPNGKPISWSDPSGSGERVDCQLGLHEFEQCLIIIILSLFPHSDFLGCAKLTLKDLLKDGDSPWTKRLLLEDVASGEIELKIDLTINKKNLLLQ